MSIRILNLEDDPHDTELIERELEQAGLDVALTRVTTLAEFEQGLRAVPPDVVLSDHNLPNFHGRRALELVQELAPDTPFILVTGSLAEEEAVGYMKAGAADYILKDRMARLAPSLLDALDRARQRRALARYQDFLRQIIDAVPNQLFVRDRAGVIRMANRAGADAFGLGVGEIVGRLDHDLDPETGFADRLFEADAEVLESGRPVTLPARDLEDRNGHTRHIQLVKVPLLTPGADELTVLTVVTDLSEHRRLELQLRQAQKMEAVGQLAGGIAHDFNNILTAILGHAELVLDQVKGAPGVREDLETIRGSAEHAASLTRQLLAFSRKQILQPRDLDLNELVHDVEKMIRRVLKADIEIVVRAEPSLGRVRADPAQISQVLMNLIVNARDAMPNGGRLTIATANAVLDETYVATHLGARPGRFVSLVVSDTGTGMTPEIRSRVFEPFFTTKPVGQGTGLGLSTVYGIIKQSEGSIWLYSEPGQGTTFRIFLPRVDGPDMAPQSQDSSAVPGGAEVILLVEDAEPVRRLAAQVLRRRGYTVLDAGAGVEAERAAQAWAGPIDLLLTDVVMPGISGVELARRLVAARPGLRVLYTSGYTDDTIVHHGVLGPDVAFLQKPFAIDDLLRSVRRALDAPTD